MAAVSFAVASGPAYPKFGCLKAFHYYTEFEVVSVNDSGISGSTKLVLFPATEARVTG